MKKIHPWALGLTVFILLFAAAVIGGAVYFSGEKVDIVAADYYEQGQRYQADIDARERTAALAWKPNIAYDRAARACAIIFPDSVRRMVEGKAIFFCVADAQGDFTRALGLDSSGAQIVPMRRARNGLWRVKLSWRMAGLEYYAEEKIVVE